MLDLAQFKKKLIDSGAVDQERLDRAQKYALEENLPLAEALIALNILTYRRLGQVVADLYELPYIPIVNNPPPLTARAWLGSAAAVQWKVLPVRFDEDHQILTVAIHDPDQIVRLEKIYRFFLPGHALAFVACSRAELEKAQEDFYDAKRPTTVSEAERRLREHAEKRKLFAPKPPSALSVASEARLANLPSPAVSTGQGTDASTASPASPFAPLLSRPYQSAFSHPRVPPPPPVDMSTPTVPPTQSDASMQAPTSSPLPRILLPRNAVPEPSYSAMAQSLLGLTGILIRHLLANDTAACLRAQTRVRYCQLLASRLGLFPVQIDTVTLAAWISCASHPDVLLKEFVNPYKIEELILSPEDSEGFTRQEARILSLIRRYQELQETDPDAAQDINLARRSLRAKWGGADEHPAMIETFLQILADEQFLTRRGVSIGTVLIVDPIETASPHIAPPLQHYGYDVSLAATPSAAEEKIARKRPDLCLIALRIGRQSGLRLCEKIKALDRANPIPCLMLLEPTDEKRAAECLRSGADDIATKPINMDLLWLKVERLLRRPEREADRVGVQGSLTHMAFSDMIQILCANNRSVEIVLTQHESKREGHVFVENGEVVHASVGELEGEGAFYELLRWHTGEFTTLPCKEFPSRTIRAPLMTLLMEGARRADEQTASSASTDFNAASPPPPP